MCHSSSLRSKWEIGVSAAASVADRRREKRRLAVNHDNRESGVARRGGCSLGVALGIVPAKLERCNLSFKRKKRRQRNENKNSGLGGTRKSARLPEPPRTRPRLVSDNENIPLRSIVVDRIKARGRVFGVLTIFALHRFIIFAHGASISRTGPARLVESP